MKWQQEQLKRVPDQIVDQSGSTIVVECCCGKTYTLTAFRRLPLDGIQSFSDPPEKLELRTCKCGSTRAIWTNRDGVRYTDQQIEEFA